MQNQLNAGVQRVPIQSIKPAADEEIYETVFAITTYVRGANKQVAATRAARVVNEWIDSGKLKVRPRDYQIIQVKKNFPKGVKTDDQVLEELRDGN